VRRIANKVAVMLKGQLVAYGDTAKIFNPRTTPTPSCLLSSVPEMRADWLDVSPLQAHHEGAVGFFGSPADEVDFSEQKSNYILWILTQGSLIGIRAEPRQDPDGIKNRFRPA